MKQLINRTGYEVGGFHSDHNSWLGHAAWAILHFVIQITFECTKATTNNNP